MPGARPDLAGPAGRHAIGRGPAAPGRVGLAVVAIALLAAIVVWLLRAQAAAFWLSLPAALWAASRCRARRTVALAAAVVVFACDLVTLAWAGGGHPPAVWAGILVPAGAVAVLQAVREGLERERDDLRDFALTDPLTRIANRRLLLAQADHEVARHLRTQRSFAVVMIDLDGFKALNDRFGHAAGDDLLRDVAAALTRAMRAQDTVARIGGDEFCVLAPETDAEGAERLVARVAHAVAAVAAGVQNVEGSVGAAVFPDDAREPEALMHIADERLFETKRQRKRGRDDRAARHAA